MTEKCHFIGIGGIGMSGLARILLDTQNTAVTGSDRTTNSLIEDLRLKGAEVHIGHDPKFIPADATVIYSSDIATDNPEYLAAQELNCKMLHRADLLVALANGQNLLGVTGTHGKTTTSGLLAHVFLEAGKDPSFAVGGVIPGTQVNGLKGKGGDFIAELDESDGSFLKFHPDGAIVTNIGSDHISHYGTKESLLNAFKQFCSQVKNPDHLFWCGDNMYLKGMALKGISYGFTEVCQLRAYNLIQEEWSVCYDIDYKGKIYTNVRIPLIGAHNALNSLAVFGLCLSLGIEEASIRKAFLSFAGICRRAEKKGVYNEILVLDDYAHHPTEISATLNALRIAIGERRLVVLYQPHRYSRIRDCLGSFGGIFDEADEVFLTEIYPAGEKPIPGISHEDIMEENEQCSSTSFRHVPFHDLVAEAVKFLQPHDVVVTLGAGNITQVGPQILEGLKKKIMLN